MAIHIDGFPLFRACGVLLPAVLFTVYRADTIFTGEMLHRAA